VIIYKRWLI